jgi:hypothetical protein
MGNATQLSFALALACGVVRQASAQTRPGRAL